MLSGIGGATESMFGREKCDYINIIFKQEVESVLGADHAGVIGQQRHPAPFKPRLVKVNPRSAHSHFSGIGYK